MRRRAISGLVGAATVAVILGGVGFSSPAALAGEARWHPGPVYSAPPVYTYGYAAAPGAHYYRTRIDIFRGPRWGYAAAYYNSGRRGGYARHRGACGHRAYLYGPIVRVPRGRR